MAFLQALEESQKLIAAECNNDALYALLLKEYMVNGAITSLNDKINGLYEDTKLLESLARDSGLLRLKIQTILDMEKSNLFSAAEKKELEPVFNILFALLIALTKAYPLNNRVLKTNPPEYEDYITLCAFEGPQILTADGVIMCAESLEQSIRINDFGYTNPLSNLPFGPRDVAYIKEQSTEINGAAPNAAPDLERYDNMLQISLGLTIHMIMLFTAITFPLMTAILIVGASVVVTISVMALVAYLKPVTRIANYFNFKSQQADGRNDFIDKLLAFVPEHEPVAEDANENNGRHEAGISESPESVPVPRAFPLSANDSIQAPPARLQLINALYGAKQGVSEPALEVYSPKI
jgi:hypothetical protein